MRVLLVDDHALVRAGIASLLRASGLEVVAQAGDGDEAVRLTREVRPDLVLMDVRMPRRNGLEATRAIKAEAPDVKIVMLTVSDDEADLFEAIKSGAEGYLLKNVHEEEFTDLLTRLRNGEPTLSPPMARKLLKEFARLKDEDSSGLTRREREVLTLVARGGTNKEVAAKLFISESTVDYHMRHILAKLHLRNRTQLAAWAFEHNHIRRPMDEHD